MATMINKLIIKYQISVLANRQYRLDFLTAYQKILLENKEKKMSKKIDSLRSKHQAYLRPFKIQAGLSDELIDKEKQMKLSQINNRYSMKFRAIDQSKKRALKRNSDDSIIKRFEEKQQHLITHQKEEAISNLLQRYQKDEIHQSESENRYSNLNQKFIDKEQKKTEVYLTKFNQQKEKIESSFSKRITLLQKKIENLRQTIYSYEKLVDVEAEMPENVLLRLTNLQMRFGGVVAIDNLSFDVKKGEIFGLIGPNGAGKTTIFNCITRFYRPTAGKMLFRKNTLEVIHLNDYPVHNIIKQGIVRTFQNVELIWELSVLDNLLVAAHTLYRTSFFGQLLHLPKLKHEEEVLRKKALNILKTLDLLPYQYMIPYGLPYGILKKIELARTLMANPKLIILDEPAAGLNDVETEALAQIIKKIRDDYKTTIILVEHDMGLVMDICDTVCAISFGKMLAIGTPQEIQSNPEVRSAYLGEEII